MIDPEIPLVTAIVLAALLVLTLATLVGHALWQRRQERRLREPLAEARRTVTEAVDGQGRDEAALAALAAVPPGRRMTVLSDLAPTLRGLQRRRLEAVARDAGVLDAAAQWAASPRWWRRLHAARLHTLLGGGEGTVDALLSDPSWEVRAEAAQWAALHPNATVIERLLVMLDDPQPLPRFASKDALRRIGATVVDPLTHVLERASGAQAAAALDVAGALTTPAMLPSALRLASDEFPQTRVRAATLLGAIGGESAVAALDGLLHDPEPDVRAAAADSLGKLGHWPAARELAAQLRDPAWEVRRNAALALRALGPPGLLLLRRALDSDDRFAADIAQQVLDLPDAAEEVILA